MIIRATSDLHLTQSNAPIVFKALGELWQDAKEHGGFTVLAGDIFDQATTVHVPTWQKLRNMLRHWPGEAIYVIAGNHDQYPGGCILNGLEAGKCRVVTTTMATRIGTMVPYVEPDLFRDAWSRVIAPGWTVPDILWCHQGFRGAYMNRMVRDQDGVGCKDIPDGKIVISGHYHMPQNLGRIIYCGSPYQISFAEEGQVKGWLRWKNALKEPIPRRVPFAFEDAPRYHTVLWHRGPKMDIPSDIREGDKVRVKTGMSLQQAQAQWEQIEKAGFAGAVLICEKQPSPEDVELRNDPKESAIAYMTQTMAGEVDQPDPGYMERFADREGLWTR